MNKEDSKRISVKITASQHRDLMIKASFQDKSVKNPTELLRTFISMYVEGKIDLAKDALHEGEKEAIDIFRKASTTEQQMMLGVLKTMLANFPNLYDDNLV